MPTKFDSALVETPNKVDLVQTVEVCELSKSCYRVPYMEYYYEIVYDANGVKEEKLKVSSRSGILSFLLATPCPVNMPTLGMYNLLYHKKNSKKKSLQ